MAVHLATPDQDENGTVLDLRGLAISARTVCELFPDDARRRPSSAPGPASRRGCRDDIPVIGPSARHAGLYHHSGFRCHGFQLGPIVGAVIAELATTGRTNLPIAPFRIDRFYLPLPPAGEGRGEGVALKSHPAQRFHRYGQLIVGRICKAGEPGGRGRTRRGSARHAKGSGSARRGIVSLLLVNTRWRPPISPMAD